MSTNGEKDDEYDELLANALNQHHTDQTVTENARLVALYYTTLTTNDVPEEAATELTCQWVTTMTEG